MSKKSDEQLSFVDVGTRTGYYRDSDGNWRRDRRVNADRRADRIVELHIRGMRKTIRRAADREMWAFITENRPEGSEDVRHVRPAS